MYRGYIGQIDWLWANWPALSMIFPTWLDHLKERFFILNNISSKNSCPLQKLVLLLLKMLIKPQEVYITRLLVRYTGYIVLHCTFEGSCKISVTYIAFFLCRLICSRRVLAVMKSSTIWMLTPLRQYLKLTLQVSKFVTFNCQWELFLKLSFVS